MFNTHLTHNNIPMVNQMYPQGQPYGYNPMVPAMSQAAFMSRGHFRSQLYVSDFEDAMQANLLFDYFSTFGKISDFVFKVDPITKKARGYAFISYVNPNDAQRAIEKANHQKILENPVRVLPYKPNYKKELVKEANLFISNLSDNINEKDIEEFFVNNFKANVFSCRITYRHGKSKGYGYIQLENANIADRILENSNGEVEIKGQKIFLQKFAPKVSRANLKNNLYIKNLPEPKDNNEGNVQRALEEEFQKYGKISSALVKLCAEPVTNKPSYYAFLCFADDGDIKGAACAEKALNELDGRDIFEIGVGLEIHYLEKKSERKKKELENNIYTKNLMENLEPNDIFRVFSEFGVICRYTLRKSATVSGSQFALIQFSNKDDYENVLKNAFNVREVADLYNKRMIILNAYQSKETRRRINEAKKRANAFNPQLMPSTGEVYPNQQQPFQIPNMPVQHPHPQMYFNQPQVGAPTVGANMQMNQGYNMPNNYNNNPMPYNQQMPMSQNVMMQNPNFGGQYIKPKPNVNKGKPARPIPNKQMPNMNMPMNKVIKELICFFNFRLISLQITLSHSNPDQCNQRSSSPIFHCLFPHLRV